MLDILIRALVVFCELYAIIWLFVAFLGLFFVAWRTQPWYPFGPSLPGSILSFIVAVVVIVVLGHHSFGL